MIHEILIFDLPKTIIKVVDGLTLKPCSFKLCLEAKLLFFDLSLKEIISALSKP